jgi:CRP-like cAMP-binding protein
MYLKYEIPFFYDFDSHTVNNLAKVMKQKVFDKNEIIYLKNDPSVDMFIVLFGDVSLYN